MKSLTKFQKMIGVGILMILITIITLISKNYDKKNTGETKKVSEITSFERTEIFSEDETQLMIETTLQKEKETLAPTDRSDWEIHKPVTDESDTGETIPSVE